MYDLLIKNGRVIDPVTDLDGRMDVAISDTRIARIAPEIDEQAQHVLDVAGKLVVPGLIDLHTHVYWGVTAKEISDLNAPPDLVGVRAGVTTLVDGGSAGYYNLGGLLRYVVPSSHTRIYAFLNIFRTGLLPGPTAIDLDTIDVERTIGTIQKHCDQIVGVKVLLTGPMLDPRGREVLRLAVRAAREAGTRLMVHIGNLAPTESRAADRHTAAARTGEMLGLLAPGDIVTHICTARPGGVLDAQGRVLPELVEASERGVVLDTAHGRTNLSFETTRLLIDQGIVPDVISTDITGGGRTWIVYSLTECMGKLLALGLGLKKVIGMVTANAARAIGKSDVLGTIAVGRKADLSILEMVEGEYAYTDSEGQVLYGDRAIVPAVTVRAGETIMPGWGPHPWGWLPAPGHAPQQTNEDARR